ncbi:MULTISPECIES: hypothetical protein [unclassified Methylobacterium]|jgi:hypothetical protein|nr:MULTISPECIES: hypothetical protein [unclassified Methylobacterium]SFU96893.1 hypothetical protein SAMN02799643_03539 [Methylobacterium sp. UNCCL125]
MPYIHVNCLSGALDAEGAVATKAKGRLLSTIPSLRSELID